MAAAHHSDSAQSVNVSCYKGHAATPEAFGGHGATPEAFGGHGATPESGILIDSMKHA